MRVSVLWNSSVFSSRGLLVETLNNKCSLKRTLARAFAFAFWWPALLEVKETKRMH